MTTIVPRGNAPEGLPILTEDHESDFPRRQGTASPARRRWSTGSGTGVPNQWQRVAVLGKGALDEPRNESPNHDLERADQPERIGTAL
jgi:hypothetical protein